jgi:STE24 endopeptidase
MKSYRQYTRYLMRNRPAEIADIVSEEDFKKAQLYNLDKSRFGFVEGLYKQIETVLMLHYDALYKIWDFAGQVLYKFTGYGTEYEVSES